MGVFNWIGPIKCHLSKNIKAPVKPYKWRDKIALSILASITVISGFFGIYAVLMDRPIIGIGLVYLFIFAYVSFNRWKKAFQLNKEEASQLKKAFWILYIFCMPLMAFIIMMFFVIFGRESWLYEFFFEWPGAALSTDVTAVIILAFFLIGLFVLLPWLSELISDIGVYHKSDEECFVEKYMRFIEKFKQGGFSCAQNSDLDINHSSKKECFVEKCMRVGFVYTLISVPLIISYLMYLRTLNMQFDRNGAALVIISTIVTLLIIRINCNPSENQIKCPKGMDDKHEHLIITHKERMLSFLFSLIFAQWIFSIIALATIIRQDSKFTFGTEMSILSWFLIIFFGVLILATCLGEIILRNIKPYDQIEAKSQIKTESGN